MQDAGNGLSRIPVRHFICPFMDIYIYSTGAATSVHLVHNKDGVKASESSLDKMNTSLNEQQETVQLNQSVNIISLCPCDLMKPSCRQSPYSKRSATICVHACVSQQYVTCYLTVTFSHRRLLLKVHLRRSLCQQKTWCAALHCADTFTCSQRYTLALAGLAVTLLADDGAHCIPWSGPGLLFSAGRVWLEGRVF